MPGCVDSEQLPSREGDVCLSVCLPAFFLSLTQLCAVLGGTAWSGVNQQLPCPSLCPAQHRVQPPPFPLAVPPACRFCGHINMEQLKSLSWLWASPCWMCSWMWRPLQHTGGDVSHGEGQHQGHRYVWSFCPAIFSISKPCA